MKGTFAGHYVITRAITTKAVHIPAWALAYRMDALQFRSEAITPSRLARSFGTGKCSAAFDMNTGWKTSLHEYLRSTMGLFRRGFEPRSRSANGRKCGSWDLFAATDYGRVCASWRC